MQRSLPSGIATPATRLLATPNPTAKPFSLLTLPLLGDLDGPRRELSYDDLRSPRGIRAIWVEPIETQRPWLQARARLFGHDRGNYLWRHSLSESPVIRRCPRDTTWPYVFWWFTTYLWVTGKRDLLLPLREELPLCANCIWDSVISYIAVVPQNIHCIDPSAPNRDVHQDSNAQPSPVSDEHLRQPLGSELWDNSWMNSVLKCKTKTFCMV